MKTFASTHSCTLNEGKVKQRFTRVQDESYDRVNVKEHSPIYDLPAYETRQRKLKRKQILKNINLENRLSLYSDYINKFGNIDVDWELQLDLVVNEYVKANIGMRLIYDDDIKYKEEMDGVQDTKGPRVQIKQMRGVGIQYKF